MKQRPSKPGIGGKRGSHRAGYGSGAGDASQTLQGVGEHPPMAREAYRTIGGGVRIVHEDSDILVVDKPAGLLTASMAERAGSGDSVFDLVKEYARQKARRRGVRAWIIHRLDKEASGLLVFAKSETAYLALKDEFKTKRAHRQYAAVVEGTFAEAGGRQPASGTIHSYLYEDERGIVHATDTPGEAGPAGAEDGQPRLAVTHFQVQAQQHTGDALGRALLHVRLETGRKHQIRVHLQSLRKPIVGDRRYGAASDPIGRLCLHAMELGFAHPRTGESMRFQSPTPGTFLVLVGAKRGEAMYAGNASMEASTASPRVRDVARAGDDSIGSGALAAGEAVSDAQSGESASPSVRGDPASQPGMQGGMQGGSQGWHHVAAWYDKLIDERGSDHHEQTILPGTMRLLGVPMRKGTRVLDLACGQGVLCRRLAMCEPPLSCVGVDAAPGLIERASVDDRASTYVVGDARELESLREQHDALRTPFDAVTCVMAIMNIEPLSPVMRGVASVLRPGGAFVCVLLHPAFRAMGQTGWVWDIPEAKPVSPKDKGKRKGKKSERMSEAFVGRQYRRVDGYLTSYAKAIVMNPGKAAHGGAVVTTTTFHRPIQAYVRSLFEAGLAITHLEEWPSLRQSQPGPRAGEENRARREIPMFLAIRAVRME